MKSKPTLKSETSVLSRESDKLVIVCVAHLKVVILLLPRVISLLAPGVDVSALLPNTILLYPETPVPALFPIIVLL
jgi:hypothetical protein